MKHSHDIGHRAKRSLGQNFLIDQSFIEKIVNAVNGGPGQVIFEIGPGRGALTSKLAALGAEVIALEIDRVLVPILRSNFAASSNVRIIEQDALTADFGSLLGGFEPSIGNRPAVKLAANLPYYISTAVLQILAAQRGIFSELVLMFQREVVDRLTAAPGTSDRGFLTVMAESSFSIERLFDVPPHAFDPTPKVWSAVVRLTPKPGYQAEAELRELISAGFAQKRKTIANNLRHVYPEYRFALNEAGIDPKRRAEALSLNEWLRLHDVIRSIGP